MQKLGRLIGELVGWRWAPAVGLCVASLFYVLVVVALVPEEIGVPTTNARLAPKAAAQPSEPELPTFPTAMAESETPPPPAPVRPAAVVDFGRRGFSPPLDRPEAPPPPVAPVAPVAPPPPVAPPAGIAAIPPPAPGSAGAAEAAAQAADGAAVAAAPAPAPSPAPANPMTLMRSMQVMRGGSFPTPHGAPSAQPAPPGAPPAGAPDAGAPQ